MSRPVIWRSWTWTVLWRPTRPHRTNTKKEVLFIIGDWNAKVGSQELPGVTGRFGLGEQSEPGQRLTKFCQENALDIANTLYQQQKRRLYMWTPPDGQDQNQTDYIRCRQRRRSSIQSAKTRPRADCGSDPDSLLPNSDLSWIEEKRESHYTFQVWPKSNPFYSGSEK